MILLLACWSDPKQETKVDPASTEAVPLPAEIPPAKGPNVVLVTLDTTRADRIGAYGFQAARTDTIDAFAAKGRRFSSAWSPLPLTIPSHATLFTGLEPYEHGIRDNGSAVLDPKFETLAEVLQGKGYATAASVAAYVTQRQWGLDQGFQAYFDDIPPPKGEDHNAFHSQRPGDQVVDDAVRWLERERPKDRSYFLWVHLYDAHDPHRPPEGYTGIGQLPYDGELAFLDDQIGRLQAAVEAQGGTLDNTLWVLAADHGEGLGGHIEMRHGLFTYANTQHVPLIMAGPGIPAEVVDQPVGLVDVAPTILSSLGIAPPAGISGKAQPGAPHAVYIESWQLYQRYGYAPHVGLVEGTLKFIDTPKPELYDLAVDPREQNNLAALRPDDVKRLQAALAARQAQPPKAPEVVDEETVRRLESLGYLASNPGTSGPLSLATLVDPKDRLPVLNALEEAELFSARGKLEMAEERLRTALKLDPSLVEARIRLARLLLRIKRANDAVSVISEALAMQPSNQMVVWLAMTTFTSAGLPEKALELSDEALRQWPESEPFAVFRVATLFLLRRPEEAVAYANQWLTAHPGAGSVSGFLGVIYAGQGRWLEAEPLLRVGAKSDRPFRDVSFYLGTMAAAAKLEPQAIQHLENELRFYPENNRARETLVRLFSARRDWKGVIHHVDALLVREPDDAEYQHAKAQALFNLGDLPAAKVALDKLLAAHPDYSHGLLLLANYQSATGDKEGGAATFEKAKAAKAREDAERAKLLEAEAAKESPKKKATPGK